MARITPAQLAAAVGGDAMLRQLLDKDGDGAADELLIAEVIDYAEGEVDSAIQVAVNLDDPAISGSKILQQRELTLAVYWTWQKGTGGQAVPPNVKDAYQDALRWLDDVAQGKRTLGTSPHPASQIAYEQIDVDPTGTGVTRETLKGLW